MDRKKHEIWSLCILTLTLLILFSLISFRPSDPTLFTAATVHRAPGNWVGFPGANLSWSLLSLLGLGSYGLPLTGFWLSWALFRGAPALPYGRTQVVGIVLLVLTVISLAAFHQPKIHLPGGEIPTGGQIGGFIAGFLRQKVYSVGAHTLLIGLFLIALVLATPFSMKSACKWTAYGLLACARGLWGWTCLCVAGMLWVLEHFREKPIDLIEEVTGDAVQETLETKPRELVPVSHRLSYVENPEPVIEVLPAVTSRKRARKATVEQKLSEPRQEADDPEAEEVFDAECVSEPGTVDRYMLPSFDLLENHEGESKRPDPRKLEANARVLEEKLSDFGVHGNVIAICPGPVITMYEYAPAPGIKISRIVGLSDDLAMALKAISIRVVAPIPGKAAIGIEVPNESREMVSIRTVLESEAIVSAPAPLTIALGEDITGQPMGANLARMPHLLIAGATGTGKSVCINAVLSSLLYRNTPDDMRLLLIDPKRIELSSYEGIPHLIHPVVTDAKMATRALRWAVQEMELRYKLLADKNARNIEGYNRTLAREKPKENGEEKHSGTEESQLQHHRLPYIVIIIDELADLMMVASREVEESITRLAQMARAAGLHLILATQRPSVDVLTGIIKANIPTRISFQVSSRIDSRTIIDGSGAESLLGSGDMLFLPPGTAKLQRIHGPFISDAEVQRLTVFWKAQQLADDPLRGRVNFHDQSSSDDEEEVVVDEKYEEAIDLVVETRQASISMLQRRLRVGYNRAARMIELMEKQGIVGPSDGIKQREVHGRKTS